MSDNPNPFDPAKLTIIEFKMLKGQVDAPEVFDTNQVEGYEIDNTLQLGFNMEDQLVRADFTIDIKTKSTGGHHNEATGHFHLVFIYSIDNLVELAHPNTHQRIELHPALGNALSSVTYSTVRGVLLTRLQGTALQNFILPVINPNQLLAPQ
jgi:hypothetical protein